MTNRPVFLAAGGTGGHVFPAEALAGALLARGVPVHLVTDSRGKAFGEAMPGVTVHAVRSINSTGGLVRKLRAGSELGVGVWQAIRLVRQHKPRAVVGFGGYPSLPGTLAAAWTRTPLVLHDQNALLGRANRLVARYATVIATSFEQMIGLPKSKRICFTGNTVRPAIAALRALPYVPPQPDGQIHVLCTGGSQGAKVFSEVLPAAFALLEESLRHRIILSQQARAETLEQTRAAYDAIGMGARAELQPFFTDMPQRIARAHLCIGRAGGSTVAEWTAAGRPAIYIPLPIAILDEQTWNARAVEQAGGGWIVPQKEFTPKNLAAMLKRILTDPESLQAAATAAHVQGRVDAAEKLADLVMEIAP